MQNTGLDGFMPELYTTITKVDAEKGVAEITIYLDGELQTRAILKKLAEDTLSTKEWEQYMKVDTTRVLRPVQIYAVAASDVIGAGRITISQIKMADNLYLEVENPE